MRSLLHRLKALFTRRAIDRDLEEEIASHRAELRADLEADGHSARDAARLAAIRFGGARQVRERADEEWRFASIEGFGRDVRLAARSLIRRPGFALAAIATLGLGIGASTAIFSVAYGIALRPLPYADPSRLVRIYEVNPTDSSGSRKVSVATFHAWRTEAPSIESAAYFTEAGTSPLADAPDAVPLRTMAVSPAFFDVLGVRPILGTSFRPESTYTRYTTREFVISYGAYRRLFGDRRDIESFVIDLYKAGRFRVIGVMPEGFEFDTPIDAWMPEIVELPVARILRGWRYDRVLARLKPGVDVAQAAQEVATVSAGLGREFPKTNAGWTATVEPLQDAVAGSFGRVTWLLLAAVAVVLLVACFNVGGLLSARAVSRDRETAIRLSLGAGRLDLLRLWLAEALMLGLAGASSGILLAWLGVSALRSAAPPFIPRLDSILVDGHALLVALGGLVVAVAVFTLVLAGRASRPALPPGGAGPTAVSDDPGRTRTRAALLVAQCAGAATLVVLAVMLARSFTKLISSDLGWQPTHVVSMMVDPPVSSRRPWFEYVQWSDEVIGALRRTSGVTSVAVASQVPLSGAVYADTVGVGRGKPTDDGRRWPATWHRVTDGYFDTMGIGLLEGRRFNVGDRYTETEMTADSEDKRPKEGVVIVTRSVARALWPGQSAIGQYLWQPDMENRPRQVVGVVGDVTLRSVGEDAALSVFMPWTQASGAPKLLVRTAGSDLSLVPAIRAVLQSVRPGTRVDQIATLDELVSRTTAQPRFTSRLVALFGAAALLLAAVGIYGTQWYLVGIRTREIGLRLALGAPRSGIILSVVQAGLMPALAGGVIGIVLAWMLGRVFDSLFFGLATVDVASFAIGGACLLAAAASAAIGPALRASRVDPMVALRTD